MGKPLIYTVDVPSIDQSWMMVSVGVSLNMPPAATNRLSNDWPLLRYADVIRLRESLMRLGNREQVLCGSST